MKAPGAESAALAQGMHDFVWQWAPTHLTQSEHTLRSYRTALTLYVTWLGERGVAPESLSASHFSTSEVESWLEWLSGTRGNSPQTCNQRLSAIRTWSGYMSRRDASFASLAVGVSEVTSLTARKTKVKGMSEEAVKAILRVPDQSTKQGRRDVALLSTLYVTAARVGELLSMRVSQLHLADSDPYAEVIGKGNKGRVLYLPERTVDHLAGHLGEFHGPQPDPDAFLFWSRNHKRGTHPLSRDAVAKVIDGCAAEARDSCPDVPASVTPHTFRHARATHWLHKKMHIAQISMLLGHANIQTTMDYLDITPEMLREELAEVAGAPQPKRWKGNESKVTSFVEYCGLTRP